MVSRELAQALLACSLDMGEIARKGRLDDLAKGEAGVLTCLNFKSGDGLLAGELSENLKLSTGRVSSILNSLSEKGYIERRDDTDDKRRVKVFLTEAGKKRAEKMYESALGYVSCLLERMGEEDSRELVRLVKKALQIIKSDIEPSS